MENEQFWRDLESIVSQSMPDDPSEELRRRLPLLPPGTEWMDFGVDLDNISHEGLRNTIRMMRRSSPRDRIFDPLTVHAYRNEQPPRSLMTDQQVYCDKTQLQMAWQLPELVSPNESYELIPMETDDEQEKTLTHSDAMLYRVEEQDEYGSLKIHSILKIMSKIPDSMLPREDIQSRDHASNTFNLFMGDVSGSMSSCWSSVVNGWNTHICPNLIGRTTIMTFGSEVATKRSGYTSDCYEISHNDFDNTSTDLTGALQAIVEEVYNCKEKFINIFFITDGGHNQTQCQPDNTIDKIRAPGGKICDVYVLGVGNLFPVHYSVIIRSRLHNGRANLPTIFWAKNENSNDMEQQMKDIASYISQPGSSKPVKLSIPGHILPFNSSQNSFHLNEYVYFDKAPEEIQDITLEVGTHRCKMHLYPKNADVDLYLNDVFRQWNGILIQIHNKKERVNPEIVPFMEKLFNTVMNKTKIRTEPSIRGRLASKKIKGYQANFQTLKNIIKNILTNEQYSNEIELAENILSTTVISNKYAEKTLCLKGHTIEDYDKDMKEFKSIIEQERCNLLKIEVTDDDICSVSNTSTIKDLKDEDLDKLWKHSKYDFLRTFTISGIPVFSPLRDSAMINPWIYSIRRILKAPYTIVSQVVLEEKFSASYSYNDDQNKGVTLQGNDKETCFNAIIPVFSPNVANQMKNIMGTKIYAMCCTFAILKNPHIIDYNIHMAALGIAWVRMLYENPSQERPEYVQYRIECIKATAAQYTDRHCFVKYRDCLIGNTNKAIITECKDENDGNTLKCESLVKPMFILYMAVQTKQITNNTIIKKIMKTILIEYIGRCLSKNVRRDKNSDKRATYSDFFTESLTDQDNKRVDMKKYVEETKAKLTENAENLLEKFYYKEQCRKSAKRAAKEVIKRYFCELTSNDPIKINKRKINQLRNVSSCGDLSWSTLKTYTKEVGLAESDSEDLFSDENIFLYVAHGFKYTNSKDRLETTLSDYNECVKQITKKVEEERSKKVNKSYFNKLVEEMVNSWLCTYTEAHAGVVEPMTKSQIIQEARMKEIDVNDVNFDHVYKFYRSKVGLMGNACQSRSCPWFLKPSKAYRDHAATDRITADFPHRLHVITKHHCTADIRTISNKIVEGECRRSDKATTLEKLAKLDLSHLKNLYLQMAIE